MGLTTDECYNCNFSGTFDWMWLIIDAATIDTTADAFATLEAEPEYFNNPDYICVETYYCPNCLADQSTPEHYFV